MLDVAELILRSPGLARVPRGNGRPVIVLPGDLPVYRTLRVGVSGPDVIQLNRREARLPQHRLLVAELPERLSDLPVRSMDESHGGKHDYRGMRRQGTVWRQNQQIDQSASGIPESAASFNVLILCRK